MNRGSHWPSVDVEHGAESFASPRFHGEPFAPSVDGIQRQLEKMRTNDRARYARQSARLVFQLNQISVGRPKTAQM